MGDPGSGIGKVGDPGSGIGKVGDPGSGNREGEISLGIRPTHTGFSICIENILI